MCQTVLMSIRCAVNRARTIIAANFRCLAVVAVAAKLLVPVGYMPAAFADGGPIMLCGPGLLAASVSSHEPGPAPHEQAGSTHSHHAAATGEAAPGQSEPEQPVSGHHEWERCSLGGLASLAAMAAEWHLDLISVEQENLAIDDVGARPAATLLAFRSRAPPVALS